MNLEIARDIVSACEQASEALSAAGAAIARMPEGEERSQHLRALAGISAGLFVELRLPAVRQYPELEVVEHLGEPNTLLDKEEQEAVSLLTRRDLELIDEAILASSAASWRKVARVVSMAMNELNRQFPRVPDGFYAQRVAALVSAGNLQSQGNLAYMRFSEVRLTSAGKNAI